MSDPKKKEIDNYILENKGCFGRHCFGCYYDSGEGFCTLVDIENQIFPMEKVVYNHVLIKKENKKK